jgi:hypothetical protein
LTSHTSRCASDASTAKFCWEATPAPGGSDAAGAAALLLLLEADEDDMVAVR